MVAQHTEQPTDLWRITCEGGGLQRGGEHMDFCTSARSGPDGIFRCIYTLPAGKKGPPEHAHPLESETLELVSGTCRFVIDDVVKDARAGDVVVIPAGGRHWMHNRGSEACVMRVAYSGASMEDVFVPAMATVRRHGAVRGLIGMLIYVADNMPTVPTSKRDVAIVKAIVKVMKRFGMRAHERIYGWDRRVP